MNIVCLDLEGVLVPEIWIAFAKETGIPELEKTTRDEPDYDKLMNYRINILKEHGLGLKEIQETIAKIDPMPGAKEFLDELRSITQVIICDIFFPAASLFYPICRKPFILNLYMTLSAVFVLEINHAFCFCAICSFLTAKISLIYVCYRIHLHSTFFHMILHDINI